MHSKCTYNSYLLLLDCKRIFIIIIYWQLLLNPTSTFHSIYTTSWQCSALLIRDVPIMPKFPPIVPLGTAMIFGLLGPILCQITVCKNDQNNKFSSTFSPFKHSMQRHMVYCSAAAQCWLGSCAKLLVVHVKSNQAYIMTDNRREYYNFF